MTVDIELLLAALEDKRGELGLYTENEKPLRWVRIAEQANVAPAAFSRLRNDIQPGEVVMQKLATWLGRPASDFEVCEECPDQHESFTVSGSTDLPIADTSRAWSGSGAATRVFDHFTDGDKVDTAGVSKAFLYRDPDADPATKAAYKLGFADIVDGTLTIIPRGVAATTGGRGVDATEGISEDEKSSIKTKVCSLYSKIQSKDEEWPDCPFTRDDSESGDGEELSATDTAAEPEASTEHVAAIYGFGSLSQSEDEDTQKLVARVAEQLTEGAVGVSIMHDMNPEDLPSQAEIDALVDAEDWDGLDALFEDISIRPRHVAIVDVPAFSNAKLKLGEDGVSVEGSVAFEGIPTGDMRMLPYNGLVWDEDLLPIPIVVGHDGGSEKQIGSIHTLERRDGVTSAMRGPEVTSEQTALVASAAGATLDAMPSVYFRVPNTLDGPLQISAPDANGLRHIFGLIAPKGVCHRSSVGGVDACFQYPGETDAGLPGLHTGFPVKLDSGETLRTAAITFKGRHLDTSLAQKGVRWDEANRHRDDANEVFAMGRAAPTPRGLGFSGVVLPDVSEDEIMRAMSCSPSIEMWGKGSGRTTIGVHLVPTPAWPVAAAAGTGAEMEFSSGAPIRVEQVPLTSQAVAASVTSVDDTLDKRLSAIENALGILVSDKIADGIDLPELPEASE